MRVTKKGLEDLILMKKQYLKNPNKELLKKINNYIDDVINCDSEYYSKLSSYNFSEEELKYLL